MGACTFPGGRPMKDEPRSIFRDKAIRNYMEGRKASVLPRLASPRNLNLLWALLCLFVAAGVGGAYFGKMPVYTFGSDGTPERGGDGAHRNVEVVVSLPEHDPGLRVGQKLTLKAHPAGKSMEASIVAVESKRPEVTPEGSGASPNEDESVVTEGGADGARQSAGQGFRSGG